MVRLKLYSCLLDVVYRVGIARRDRNGAIETFGVCQLAIFTIVVTTGSPGGIAMVRLKRYGGGQPSGISRGVGIARRDRNGAIETRLGVHRVMKSDGSP